MSNSQEMRKYINVLVESAKKDVDIDYAKRLLMKLSPTAKEEMTEMDESFAGALGGTIALVAVTVGGVEVTTIGPFDVSGAEQMARTIEQDIVRSYENYHPRGWTDGSGTIYMLDDWGFEVKTMHSSEFMQQQDQDR